MDSNTNLFDVWLGCADRYEGAGGPGYLFLVEGEGRLGRVLPDMVHRDDDLLCILVLDL